MSYKRSTVNEYQVLGKYYHGWELETTERTMSEAIKRLQEYKKNVPEYEFCIKVVRVSK